MKSALAILIVSLLMLSGCTNDTSFYTDAIMPSSQHNANDSDGANILIELEAKEILATFDQSTDIRLSCTDEGFILLSGREKDGIRIAVGILEDSEATLTLTRSSLISDLDINGYQIEVDSIMPRAFEMVVAMGLSEDKYAYLIHTTENNDLDQYMELSQQYNLVKSTLITDKDKNLIVSFIDMSNVRTYIYNMQNDLVSFYEFNIPNNRTFFEPIGVYRDNKFIYHSKKDNFEYIACINMEDNITIWEVELPTS